MSVNFLIEVAGTFGEGTVLILTLRRGMLRSLPIFSGYMAWAVLSDILEFLLLWRTPYIYLNLLHWLVLVDATLRVPLLIEIFLSIGNRNRQLRSFKTNTLMALIFLGAMVPLWPLTQDWPPYVSRDVALAERFEQVVAMLTLASLLVLACMKRQWSLSWKDPRMQIVAGLGAYSGVSLVAKWIRFDSYPNDDLAVRFSDHLLAFAYVAVLTYWVFCFRHSRPKLRVPL